MRFSLVYPEYRLLDIKALTEYHAACVTAHHVNKASDLMYSDQTLSFLDGSTIQLTTEEYDCFVDACSSIYSLLMYTTLNAFFVLVHKLCIDFDTEPDTEYGGTFTVDLDSYLKIFSAMASIAPNTEAVQYLTERLNNAATDFPDIVQEELARLKRDGKFTIATEFNKLVNLLGSNPHIAELLSQYMQIALVDSYSKILFGNETVLTIYADLPALRDGVTQRLITDSKGRIKSYEEIREEYLDMVRDLTFHQDQNLTSIYQKYIGSNIDRVKGAIIRSKTEDYSMVEMKGGEGKTNAIVDIRVNKGTALTVTEDTTSIEPGLLFAKVFELDSKTAKDKIRKRIQILSLVDAFNFGYSTRAKRKYPIRFLDTDGINVVESRWIYSFHRNGYQGSTPGVTELHLPLCHIVNYILNKEMSLKEEQLGVIWKQIMHRYPTKYAFSVQMPDNTYLQKMLSISDTQSYNLKITAHETIVKNVDTQHLAVNNWLYFAWRLSTLGKDSRDNAESFNDPAAMERFKEHIHNMASGSDFAAFNSIYVDNLSMISDYRLVINELYRLNSALKSKGMSLSKLWYVYLSNNFERIDVETRKIVNAYSYIVKTLDTPTGYTPSPSRYSADVFLQQSNNKVKPSFIHIATGLTNNTAGKTETVFATFRKSVHSAKNLIQTEPVLGDLTNSPEECIKRISQRTYDLFKQDYFSYISDLLLTPSKYSRGHAPTNYRFITCLTQLLNWLQDAGLGECIYYSDNYPNEFKLNMDAISQYESTADLIKYLVGILEKDIQNEGYSYNAPFLEMALAYIVPMSMYLEVYNDFAHKGIITCDSRGLSEIQTYLADLARRVSTDAVVINRVVSQGAQGIKANSALLQAIQNYNVISSHFVESVFERISDDPKLTLQFIISRALSLIYAHKDIAVSLESLIQPLLVLDALTKQTMSRRDAAPMTSLIIALDNFRAVGNLLPKLIFRKTDIVSADQSELGAALLFGADITDISTDAWDMTVDPKTLGADIFAEVKLGNPLELMHYDKIKHCTFYFYCLSMLKSYYISVSNANKAIQSTLNSRLYLQNEYRPYEVVDKIPAEDCRALYTNLYRILGPKRDLDDEYLKSAADRINAGISCSGSERGFFNIKQFGAAGMSMDERFLNFIIQSESSKGGTPGADKCYIDKYAALYYHHSSGVYICGRIDDSGTIPLIITDEDITILLDDT